VKSLYQKEILELDDKDLQLRYLLGGLNSSTNLSCDANRFWSCDVKCSCTPIPDDDRLLRIKEFVSSHNISNETFIVLLQGYLRGSIVSYKGNFGCLLRELESVVLDYGFNYSSVFSLEENDLGERELLELIRRDSVKSGSKLNVLLEKYSLAPIDFMVLAKTSLNYNFINIHGSEPKDLRADLISLLSEYNLYLDYEVVKNHNIKSEESFVSDKKGKSLFKRFKDIFNRY